MEQPDLFSKRKKVRPPRVLEWKFQASIADLLDRWIKPGWRFTHIPSGELRDKGTAAKLQRMGVRKGWPDLVLLGPPGLHCLELKRLGEELTEDQEQFRHFCQAIGVPFAWTDNFDGALAIIKEWQCLKVNVRTGA